MTRVPPSPGSPWLVAGGLLSLAAAALHLACIAGGEEWYRFFGAGEEIAMAAGRGKIWPHLVTLGIAGVLAVAAAYAFSGAGRVRRLPLLRSALIIISAIYLARGLVIVPAFAINGTRVMQFILWSSLIVLVYGVVHTVGTARAWSAMCLRRKS